jgi:MYXO-CTERM domain-containing protein
MRAWELSALAFGTSLALGCSGGAGELLGDSTEGISGGTLDRTHHAVYQTFTHFSADDSVGACTATLIAPNVLLTARHCISSSDSEIIQCGRSTLGPAVPGQAVAATNSAILDSSSIFHRGADVRVPAEGNDTCGFDIALVILEDVVSRQEAIPAVPRIDRNVNQGEAYAAVGYGQDETGAQTPGRMLRSGLTVTCDVGRCSNFGVTATEFVGEAGVCSGDSGGPALDVDGKVVGVVSRGADPCEQPIYSSVASWSEWIMETTLDAAAAGGYEPPFWALSGSSDPPVGVIPEGEACSSADACQAGLVCYYALDPSDATCTATCGDGVACSAGTSCTMGYAVPGGGLCLSGTTTSGDTSAGASVDEGCSVSTAPRPSTGSAPWLVLGLAALARSRRWRSVSSKKDRDPREA